MAFWSGEKLAARLPSLLGSQFDPNAVKSARYALRIGAEVYVTSSRASGGPKHGVTLPLKANEAFKIPPGQFAFLLTEESVVVPDDALALISIKTHLKYRGLVNVSGFHVDPGWKGHLKFGIYNAGPADVQLRRGDEMFLIWYADLDQKSVRLYKNTPSKGAPHIPAEYTSNMVGQIYSPQVLADRIRKIENWMVAIWTLIIATLGAVVLVLVSNVLEDKKPAAQIFVAPQAAPATTSSTPATGSKEGANTPAGAAIPQSDSTVTPHQTGPVAASQSGKKHSDDAKPIAPATK